MHVEAIGIGAKNGCTDGPVGITAPFVKNCTARASACVEWCL